MRGRRVLVLRAVGGNGRAPVWAVGGGRLWESRASDMIRTMSAADTRKTQQPSAAPPPRDPPAAETCDYCGSTDLVWVKCKLICHDCRQINKSCADL